MIYVLFTNRRTVYLLWTEYWDQHFESLVYISPFKLDMAWHLVHCIRGDIIIFGLPEETRVW